MDEEKQSVCDHVRGNQALSEKLIVRYGHAESISCLYL